MQVPSPETPALDALNLMAMAHQGGADAALTHMALYARASGARMRRLSLSPRGPGSVAVMFDLDVAEPPPGGVLEVG